MWEVSYYLCSHLASASFLSSRASMVLKGIPDRFVQAFELDTVHSYQSTSEDGSFEIIEGLSPRTIV